MKIKKALSVLFALLAVALAGFTLWVTLDAVGASPVLMVPPAAAAETADTMLAAVCAGDYDAAEDLMYGSPDLGVGREPADAVGGLLWDAFVHSTSYTLVGDCYATDSGVAQDVIFSCLDLSSVTATLGERAQLLLVERVEEAEDADAVYDENGDYREDFVMTVLQDVTKDALIEDAEYIQKELTVNLVYKQGQWWVVADQALLSAISGGVTG